MPLSTGQILNNRYRIVKLLGQGGFGAVYRAWDTSFNLPCAVKENSEVSEAAQRQFMREAQILHTLRHPNLPMVKDYFFIPGQGQYLVMDFVEGEDLSQILENRGEPIPESQAVGWIEQICDALSYLHSQEPPIIHRDIKPANIKITPKGQAVLVDFGIAKLYDPKSKTTLGARAVTPGYAPYEQYGQGSTDARTDVYAIGATLYTLLTGQEPVESIQRVAQDTLPTPRSLNPMISAGVEQAILKAMSVVADRRWPTADEFKQALAAKPGIVPQPASPRRQPVMPTIQPTQTVISEPAQATSLGRPVSPNLQAALVVGSSSRKFPLWGWAIIAGGMLLLVMIMIVSIPLILPRAAKTTLAPTEPVAVINTQQAPTAVVVFQPTVTKSPTIPRVTPTKTVQPTPTQPCAPASNGILASVDPRGQYIVWWHNHSGSRGEFLLSLVQQFNASNVCGITVGAEYQGSYNDLSDKMNAGLQSGDLPALVVGYQNNEAFYQKVDGLVDMNVYVDDLTWGLTEAEIVDFYPGLWMQSIHPAYDYQRLGFPPNRMMEVLFYNATWAKELGFYNPPTSPMEFEVQACAGAAVNGDGTGGFILRDDASAVAAWTFAFGGTVLAEDGVTYVYNSQATIDAMTMLKRMYDKGCAYFFTEGYPDPEFAARHALFTMGSTSGIPFYVNDLANIGSSDDFAVLAIPYTTEYPVQNIYGGDVMIPKTSPEQQLAAWIFIKWFTSPDIQAEWVKATNYFPTRATTNDFLADYMASNPQWAAANALLPYGIYEPQLISYTEVRAEVTSAFNRIMQGANIRTTLDELTQIANQLQAEMSK